MERTVTNERLRKYFSVTGEALAQAREAVDTSTPERERQARDVLDMASRYHADALHFEEQGDAVTAFAALNYAHGWLDAGARLGLLKVRDSRLFTVE